MPKNLPGFVIGICLVACMGKDVAAFGWQAIAFAGQPVNFVVTDPGNPRRIAAGVAGELKLSSDGGVTWLRCPVPGYTRSISFDPIDDNLIYAASDTGVYAGDETCLDWRQLSLQGNLPKLASAIVATPKYIYASASDGAGTQVRVMRYARNGSATDVNFPSPIAAAFAYDEGHNRLFVGAKGGVYWTEDDGATWSGGGAGAGQGTSGLADGPDGIWQISSDGLFRSQDRGNSWNRISLPGSIDGLYYGANVRLNGLMVSNGVAYYGAADPFSSNAFLARVDGAGQARSLLKAHILWLAAAGNRLLAATTSGLMASDELLTTEARVRRPLIIVPGILGSMPTSESLTHYFSVTGMGVLGANYRTPFVLDPFEHTYDKLTEDLIADGFVAGVSLFTFPYDWMADNAVTAGRLKQKIADIRATCRCEKVDIVAHSMGGLVARAYIQSSTYAGDVENLIEIATPNSGAVDAYSAWEGGELPGLPPTQGRVFSVLTRLLSDDQTQLARTLFVRSSVPSLRQLLPVTDYIEGRSYPEGYPRNEFLESLNSPNEVRMLRQRVGLYEIGSRSMPTVRGVSVGEPGLLVWPHGRPFRKDYAVGDGTVTSESLESLSVANAWVQAGHGDIVGRAEPYIARFLLGAVTAPWHAAGLGAGSELATVAGVHGPVEVTITGASCGVISQDQIDPVGAYYSGAAMNPQIISVPSRCGSFGLNILPKQDGHLRLAVAPADTEDIIVQDHEVFSGREVRFMYDADLQVLSKITGDEAAAEDRGAPMLVNQVATGSPLKPQAVPLAAVIPSGGQAGYGRSGRTIVSMHPLPIKEIIIVGLGFILFWCILLVV